MKNYLKNTLKTSTPKSKLGSKKVNVKKAGPLRSTLTAVSQKNIFLRDIKEVT